MFHEIDYDISSQIVLCKYLQCAIQSQTRRTSGQIAACRVVFALIVLGLVEGRNGVEFGDGRLSHAQRGARGDARGVGVRMVVRQAVQFAAHHAHESEGEIRVELGARAAFDFIECGFGGEGFAIRAVGGERGIHIGHGQQAAHPGNFVAAQTVGIALSVVALVVVAHAADYGVLMGDVAHDESAEKPDVGA